MNRLGRVFCVVAVALAAALSGAQQSRYERPPAEVLDVLNAPLPPTPFLNPKGDAVIFAKGVRYPPIADLAEPMLRLAGLRVNPRTLSTHSAPYWVRMSIKRLGDGVEVPVALPAGIRFDAPQWNASGTRFAFTAPRDGGLDLWVGDPATGQATKVQSITLTAFLGFTFDWLPDQQSLLVNLVPAGRAAPPLAPVVPPGPKIQENTGVAKTSSTYEVRDVLKSAYDAELFDYTMTSQPAILELSTGKVTPLGQPAIYDNVAPSPDGQYFLVERLHKPYSYQRAYYRFPRDVEVWDRGGQLVETLANLPLADGVPTDGVPTGPRDHRWQATAPATVAWIEALDGGDPKNKAPFRDVVKLKPVRGAASELWKSEQRFAGLWWIEKASLALASDYDRDRRWWRVFLIDAAHPQIKPRLVWDMSGDEKYANPGDPIFTTLPSGHRALLANGDFIYLDGNGSSPEGDRPFLDRLNLRTLKAERLFRSERSSYETFIAWVDPAKGTFITRRETPTEPPNFYLRTIEKKPLKKAPAGEPSFTSASKAITTFPNTTPQLAGITKKLVTYQRADGVPLSFTLYLPPGYKEGTRLPTVFWAYPLEYAEKSTAGQVEGSTKRFTTIRGTSQLFFLLAGYAVLDNVAMPCIGPPETVYDTYIEQLVGGAKAAIDKAVELGVTDPERIGIGGHSHGAFMTANLLVYSDLFRAGIARSGAFNHTLRPFGFQSEKRTLWQAKDTYIKLSPVLQADKINEPLLIIHGEIDANPGTVTMQSEKLYEALNGLGKTTRLVILPYESHGYQARESTEHVLYEMISWFDRHVKNAPPRNVQASK